MCLGLLANLLSIPTYTDPDKKSRLRECEDYFESIDTNIQGCANGLAERGDGEPPGNGTDASGCPLLCRNLFQVGQGARGLLGACICACCPSLLPGQSRAYSSFEQGRPRSAFPRPLPAEHAMMPRPQRSRRICSGPVLLQRMPLYCGRLVDAALEPNFTTSLLVRDGQPVDICATFCGGGELCAVDSTLLPRLDLLRWLPDRTSPVWALAAVKGSGGGGGGKTQSPLPDEDDDSGVNVGAVVAGAVVGSGEWAPPHGLAVVAGAAMSSAKELWEQVRCTCFGAVPLLLERRRPPQQ